MKRKFNLDLSSLTADYAVANTPLFWFKKLAQDESLVQLAEKEATQALINEFVRIASQSIQTVEDLVYAYSVYMAIILKDDDTSANFLENEGNIQFEWFPELVSAYQSYHKTVQTFNISASPSIQITTF